MSDPENELGYTIHDDGVWLRCYYENRQHWVHSLGFGSSVADAAEVWNSHLQAAHAVPACPDTSVEDKANARASLTHATKGRDA